MFQGSFVALVTPFAGDEVDYGKLAELVDMHLDAGTDAIVPVGTTGESPTLSHEEHREVIRFTVERVGGKVPVIGGTGSNSTSEAIELTRFAEQTGADGALVVTPYYNKPTQAGLYEHYKAIANSVKIPIVLYDVPSRTGITIAPETVARLAQIPNIIALKDATGTPNNVSKVLNLCEITVLSGDDGLALPMMAVGARGLISVLANIVPKDTKRMCDAALAGDYAAAREVHAKLFQLASAIFSETNPIGIKTAMRLAGMLNGEMRLPLVPMGPANEEKLRGAMIGYGILQGE